MMSKFLPLFSDYNLKMAEIGFRRRGLISDRETSGIGYAGKRWIANTQNVDRSLSRGSLVRWLGRETHFICETY
jgi:hypothetical protein